MIQVVAYNLSSECRRHVRWIHVLCPKCFGVYVGSKNIFFSLIFFFPVSEGKKEMLFENVLAK